MKRNSETALRRDGFIDRSGGLAKRIHADDPARVNTSGVVIFRNSFEKQRHLGEVERFLHGPPEPDSPIERRAKTMAAVSLMGRFMPMAKSIVLRDFLDLGPRPAGVEYNDADIVFQRSKELGPRPLC